MISTTRLTVSGLRARAVDVPVRPPLETASAEIRSAPLVLVDLLTEEGVTGHSYVFCVTPLALAPLARLVSNLEPLIEGDAVAPLEIEHKLQGRFRLLGPQGLTGMAMAAIDVAAWDTLAKAHDLPLVKLLVGERDPIPAYASLRAMGPRRGGRKDAGLQPPLPRGQRAPPGRHSDPRPAGVPRRGRPRLEGAGQDRGWERRDPRRAGDRRRVGRGERPALPGGLSAGLSTPRCSC
jgi:hypothetical protein